MSLQLDARQRAMLRELGVEVFWPEAPVVARAVEAVEVVEVARRAPTPALPQGGREQGTTPAVPRGGREQGTSPVVLRAGTEATGVLRQRLAGVAEMEWESLAAAVQACRACKLCEGRTNTVFGVGDPQADWMVIGEAPGETEDLQGEPFVGPAGKLLDNMLAALGLSRRKGVYIANVLKCRPPGNRNPEPDEIAQCEPFLRRQVELLRPKMILAMGRFAVHTLLQTTEPIGRLRGRVHRYHDVPVVVTYHPAYLLRNLPDKSKAWADLCLARSVMNERA